MKKKQEPAQSLLTIEPDRKFKLDADGFIMRVNEKTKLSIAMILGMLGCLCICSIL